MLEVKKEKTIKYEMAKIKKGLISEEALSVIEAENLLPASMVNRLKICYPQHAAGLEEHDVLFTGREQYKGLRGFREVVQTLQLNGVEIGRIDEREFFVEVYRFLATRHVLNSIDWNNYQKDPLFHLVIPQPDMIPEEPTRKYVEAKTAEERTQIAIDYMEHTNPHDGKQQLNKPWFENEYGHMEFVEGSQHKYPQCQLVFDKTTQDCFAFCTYCFRHAQVRGDEDMFLQHEVRQVHDYMKQHKEITDLLITGGDAGYLPVSRLREYVKPIMEDPELFHIRTVRLGTRVLTFNPEIILKRKYNKMLELFDELRANGIQLAYMSHFSTPREVLNPATLAAIRRLQKHGVTLKSQSPIMNHVSLYTDENGQIDIDRSAQNWIDLANILAMNAIGFHSMYCARPTGEHHYFTAPLADINKIFRKIYRSLASINRPSRHISMTSSAGKISIIGTAEVQGETTFALAFTEARNMKWLDKVFLAKHDEKENTIELLKPYDTEEFFFEEELREIEKSLEEALKNR